MSFHNAVAMAEQPLPSAHRRTAMSFWLNNLSWHHFCVNLAQLLPFYPNVVFVCLPLLFQRRYLAHIIAKSYPIRTVIQLLSKAAFHTPSINSQREGVKYYLFWIFLQKFFSPLLIADFFRSLDNLFFCPLFNWELFMLFSKVIFEKAKQKSRYIDIKNRREHCSRFKMMFYVSALKFKDGTVLHPLTRWQFQKA